MNDQIGGRPLEPLTMTELKTLERTATRYSELMREREYLVGLMCLAVREGDRNLKATTKRRLEDKEIECNECYAALRGAGQEMLREAA